jgi:hypothetical protein
MSKRAASPDPDLAKWCAVLSTTQTPDVVPPGWKTVKQLAAQLGRAETSVARMLRTSAEQGLVEVQSFSVVTGQRRYPTPHYRLK